MAGEPDLAKLAADVAWIRDTLERIVAVIEAASHNPILARVFGGAPKGGG